ncbi:unnamed protein product [Pleuronectes platessa]|uniref:ATPase AAA-type core domain-containing protein n=1 Tax=Pleuronectes platessa TaxID=8262 RepID=A0A9N7VPX8_PLEPL|nr:unnamed protein product [Pleuronectes platessa]
MKILKILMTQKVEERVSGPTDFLPDTTQSYSVMMSRVSVQQSMSMNVTLLSGPQGLGKTTLAHVIVKHAGYNVVEINART